MRRLVPLATAVTLAVLGFLPVADWIPGGRHAPRYEALRDSWLSGGAIVVGVALVLVILSRRWPALWPEGAWARVAVQWRERPARTSAAVAAAATVLYAVIARTVFDAQPLLIDELVQGLQARIFAGGALSLPTHAEPAFFSLTNVVDAGGRYFGQFPPGWSVALALGELAHAAWLVGPLAGGACVLAWGWWLRVAEPEPTVALGALLLGAFSPFIAFMAGSQMNHVGALAAMLAGLAATAETLGGDRPRPGLALVAGLSFGVAATIRPVDALTFALAAAAWFLWALARDRARWIDAASALAGVSAPIALLFAFNAMTTGGPLTFGYVALWGPRHSLGFHVSPWGVMHTPAMGAQLLNLYFLRLQLNLFETPLPSLLPAVLALALLPRLARHERLLLAATALLALAYWAYFHDGYYLGARFFIPVAPILLWWTARLPRLVRERFGAPAQRGVAYAYGAAAVMGAVLILPLRVHDYGSGLTTMRWDAARAEREAGVANALVFVREPWGAQVIARLWRLGVTRGESEVLYKRVDLCALDSLLTGLERTTARGPAVIAAVNAIREDSSALEPMPDSPDKSGRMRRGATYGPACLARLAEDRAGTTLLGPLLFPRRPVLYARDLHGRDTLLLAEHPERSVWVLAPSSSDEGATPVFRRASRDSIVAAARREAAERAPAKFTGKRTPPDSAARPVPANAAGPRR
ncbi:MAG: hypothetical protein HY275_19420 [Gemmatimonadetes bacterium]|nr:hypothetical protein [Gemmatimonadota bacterium]